jgi:hypothetical protein
MRRFAEVGKHSGTIVEKQDASYALQCGKAGGYKSTRRIVVPETRGSGRQPKEARGMRRRAAR